MRSKNIIDELLRAATSEIDAIKSRFDSLQSHVQSLGALAERYDRGRGFRWEKVFSDLAEERGLIVSAATDSKHDVVVNGLRVQCKWLIDSNPCICATPILGRDYRGYYREDWDVLALKQGERLLIIPVDALLLDDGRRVSNYIPHGEYVEWVDRWDVFGTDFVFQRESQKHLFDR